MGKLTLYYNRKLSNNMRLRIQINENYFLSNAKCNLIQSFLFTNLKCQSLLQKNMLVFFFILCKLRKINI